MSIASLGHKLVKTKEFLNTSMKSLEVSKRDDTFTGTTIRAAHCDSLSEGVRLSYARA
jgi:hypothetical protein